jgi:DNA gyrase inhibitor GyrI
LEANLELIPASRIAFMRQTGPYGPDNINLMEKFKQWAKRKGLFDESAVLYAIAQDNPQNTPDDDCRYDVCLVVSPEITLSESEVLEACLPAGKYLVFTLAHTADAVQNAWIIIFPQTIAQGYQPDPARPVMERYRVDYVNRHLCEICVPVL